MDENEVIRLDQGQAGEYQIRVAGTPTPARLTWVARQGAGGEVRVAEHTLVPRELEGRGIAGQLVRALIADAREQGFRIEPQCSYVAAQFARYPDWADLRA